MKTLMIVMRYQLCRGNRAPFTIPRGGYARIHDDEVKVYKRNGDHVETRGITKYDCTW
ncbi:MAG: hypothetical protein KQH53_14440 [Desulfarculaceae bacterium]|nr:hypothetical protein [Desulfarculaceae bacterium]